MKKFVDWLYTNWILMLLILGIGIFGASHGLIAACENVISMVKFPAYNKGMYKSTTGETYYLEYDNEGNFFVLSSDMELIYTSNHVKSAIPEGNTVRVQLEDGRELIVDIDTRQTDCIGIIL